MSNNRVHRMILLRSLAKVCKSHGLKAECNALGKIFVTEQCKALSGEDN